LLAPSVDQRYTALSEVLLVMKPSKGSDAAQIEKQTIVAICRE
jgi:hypothetical protein